MVQVAAFKTDFRKLQITSFFSNWINSNIQFVFVCHSYLNGVRFLEKCIFQCNCFKIGTFIQIVTLSDFQLFLGYPANPSQISIETTKTCQGLIASLALFNFQNCFLVLHFCLNDIFSYLKS